VKRPAEAGAKETPAAEASGKMQEEKSVKVVKTEYGPARMLCKWEWSEDDDQSGIGWTIKINSQQISDYSQIFLKSTITDMSISVSTFSENIRYNIRVKGSDKVTVTISKIISGWRRLTSMTIQPVNTWFANPTQLVDMLKQFGVKETCKRILRTVTEAVNDFMQRVNSTQEL
jgi:hypothetical protein